MKDLNNRIVLLTGAGGGFGKEFIRHFSQEGCQLILSDLKKEMVEANLKDFTAAKVLGIIESDLSNDKGVNDLYEQVIKTSKTVDVLVNNAGIASFGNFYELPMENWQRIMQINTMALMQLTHLCLPQMIKNHRGHIVNISSIAGHVPAPGLSVYNTSKFAVRGFSLALSQEVQKHNIQVTAVYPFFAKTNILDSQRFGDRKEMELPDFLVDSPEKVIDEVMHAVKSDQLEVFPSLYAKTTATMQRFAPWAGELLNKMVMK